MIDVTRRYCYTRCYKKKKKKKIFVKRCNNIEKQTTQRNINRFSTIFVLLFCYFCLFKKNSPDMKKSLDTPLIATCDCDNRQKVMSIRHQTRILTRNRLTIFWISKCASCVSWKYLCCWLPTLLLNAFFIQVRFRFLGRALIKIKIFFKKKNVFLTK